MSFLTPSTISTTAHLNGTTTPSLSSSTPPISITPLPTRQSTPSILPSTSSTALPRILCLHGGGTNTTIFSIQTSRLHRLLFNEFEFIFADGPFEGPAGPGVLPTFEGCDPFFRWTRVDRTELPKESRAILEGVMERGKGGGGNQNGASKEEQKGEIIAVLGFSQGAKVAAGMLLEQQRYLDQRKAGARTEGNSTSCNEKHAFNWNLKFAVLMNGGGPPATTATIDEDGDRGQETVRDIPTIHVLGKMDPYLEHGRELYGKWFEGGDGEVVATGDGEGEEEQLRKKRGKAVLLEFDVGHRLPLEPRDSETVANEIRRLWRETKGMQEEGSGLIDRR